MVSLFFLHYFDFHMRFMSKVTSMTLGWRCPGKAQAEAGMMWAYKRK